jgi:hypothetical protein
MSRTCLELLKKDKNFSSLNSLQKTTMAFMQPVQTLNNDNNVIDSVDNNGLYQCSFPTNTNSLFDISGNNINISQNLFWDRPDILTDMNYTMTTNTDYPTSANIVSPQNILGETYDAYYNLFKDDIIRVVTLCNLVKSYTISNAALVQSNNSIFNEIGEINTWTIQLKQNIANLKQQNIDLLAQLRAQQLQYPNIKNAYVAKMTQFNKAYKDYSFIDWPQDSQDIISQPNFVTIPSRPLETHTSSTPLPPPPPPPPPPAPLPQPPPNNPEPPPTPIPGDCVWNDWVDDNVCKYDTIVNNVACGKGTSTQTRTIKQQADIGGNDCTGSTSQPGNACSKPCPLTAIFNHNRPGFMAPGDANYSSFGDTQEWWYNDDNGGPSCWGNHGNTNDCGDNNNNWDNGEINNVQPGPYTQVCLYDDTSQNGSQLCVDTTSPINFNVRSYKLNSLL